MASRGRILTSVFDMFKIGIGPSSSHTVGPMKACNDFVNNLVRNGLLERTEKVNVSLFGSLALTGKGHATDTACMYGLFGESPDTVNVEKASLVLQQVRDTKSLRLGGTQKVIDFCENKDIRWVPKSLPHHPNALQIRATDLEGNLLHVQTYYSVGGGFIVSQDEVDLGFNQSAYKERNISTTTGHYFECADDILRICKEKNISFSDIVMENEMQLHGFTEEEINWKLDEIWSVMNDSIERGLHSDVEYLPGKLNVKRRAPQLRRKLTEMSPKLTDRNHVSGKQMRRSHSIHHAMLPGMTWVSVFAMAVSEENAAGSRVVTAPTNGACGIIPAVLKYALQELIPKQFHGIGSREDRYCLSPSKQAPRDFLLTAGLVGMIFKHNASISGAEAGCQGEVGVATSMAAAGLTAVMGGSPIQIERAAEIGMEHCLGLTCDPIGGLVQIPCMERNSVSSNKAVNAASLAILNQEESAHVVSLDKVVQVMKKTGDDMSHKYKETSLGGLALEFDEQDMIDQGYTVNHPAC
mmetsp:Transcript_14833/g.17336  ORF Transcript_14833/g.17336 Transcript_14833/m.17336 type:complete len:524 (+) Transcript_14833:239-1810(+)